MNNSTKNNSKWYGLFEDGNLNEYINNNLKDPWKDTPFKDYVFLSPKQKGEFGEQFVSNFMKLSGHKVENAKSSTAGHDRIIDGIRTEIKFSLAQRSNKKGGIIKDKFMINHISVGKDWERLIFSGINPNEKDICIKFFTKEDFIDHLNSEECCFKMQQGGKSIGNDDYICPRVSKLLECNLLKDISKW